MKIFADTAILDEIKLWNPKVDGFTTNPSLMRQAGVTDYEGWARKILDATDKPVSLEVTEEDNVVDEARQIASWGPNVWVKVPITDTKGISMVPVISKLAYEGVNVNVTAVFTPKQAYPLGDLPVIISVFAGRIADTGVDPVKIIKQISGRVLWASTRELLNIAQAKKAGCDIITVPVPILTKLHLIGKDLTEYSLETVQQFYRDAK